MRKQKIERTIITALIFSWAYIVFIFSSQEGVESSGVSRKFVEFFIKEESLVELLIPYVRKLAHFTEYAIGGMLFTILFSKYDWENKTKIIAGIMLGNWYAIIDELHQLMVPGRHGSIKDVCIDTLGVIAGVLITTFIIKIIEKQKEKNKKTEEINGYTNGKIIRFEKIKNNKERSEEND